jgi:peptidoglycan/xylan/chitin deacetylase (PgdA/CDA1 family)
MRAQLKLWRPPGFLVFSVIVAFVCAVGVGCLPRYWPAFLVVVLADQAVLIGSGFVPRSRLLGANITRLSGAGAHENRVALTFDDGPDPEVTPAVLKILARHQVKATFFCVGKRAEENPELVAEIAETGHTLGNHTWSHSHAFWFLGPKRLIKEIDSTQKVLQGPDGRSPTNFRAPAGIRSPILDFVLARRGLKFVSWTRRGFDTVDHDPNRVLRRLTKSLAPGDILLLHDGAAARDADGRPVVLEVLPRLLDVIHGSGLVAGALEIE